MLHGLGEHLVRQVSSIGELHDPRPTFGAGFNHGDGGLGIPVVEDGNHADVEHGVEDGHSIVLSHLSFSLRFLQAGNGGGVSG